LFWRNTGTLTYVSTTDKITYSTDLTVAQTSTDLTQARGNLAGMSDGSSKGYFVGGQTSSVFGGGIVDTAEKITFSTDTIATQTTAKLSVKRTSLSAIAGQDRGYFAGGISSGIRTTADKIIFSTDTTAAQTSANLSQARYDLAGVSEGSSKGYFAGGDTNSSNRVATADKTTYSNDTTSAQTTANLSQARFKVVGIGQEYTLAFGNNSITSGNIASGQINNFHFSSGTYLISGLVTSGSVGDNAIFSGNIASGQIGRFQINDFNAGINIGTTRGGDKGYFAGGNTNSYVATTDKLTYVTDTTAAQASANLITAKGGLAGVSEGSTKGYFAGGRIVAGGVIVSTAEKLTYSTDTSISQTTANLSQSRWILTGISHYLTKGYFAGGTTALGAANGVSTADKLTYSTDTSISQTTANLSQARGSLAGISQGSTKGYFAGGATNESTYLATAEKLTYSNDTTTAQTTANLSQARRDLSGISGDGIKGYFAGGSFATADKTTYSTDTTAAQTTANLQD
jgi:hypothetical protein